MKAKALREQEFQHEKEGREREREAKDMKNDIEKLLKLISRLKKRTKVHYLRHITSHLEIVVCCIN